jgi:TonB family protein
MTGLHVGLVLSLVTALAQQSVPSPAPDATVWPSPGVLSSGAPGVTPPRLIADVKAEYTADAMRARIQGIAVLQCVVEPDGQVGPVRIVRSLDAVHGLDGEAIRTLRKWRFVPAMKDGVAVRVAVTVEISFTIRGGPDSPRPILGWPDAFADTSEVSTLLPAGWSEDSVETSSLEVRVSYPPGWSIWKGTAGNLASLVADDARGHRSVTISHPGPAPFDLVAPLPEARLTAFLEGVGRMQAAQTSNVRMIQSGQVRTREGLWLWLEMASPTIDLSSAPAELAAHMRTAHDGLRMWSFITTAGGQSIQVSCWVMHRASTSEADKQEEIRRAGLEFGAMLKRISIRTR